MSGFLFSVNNNIQQLILLTM